MLRPRVIPCLLVKNGGLVKTVGFARPKYVGDPINAVRIFNEKEVDELFVADIDATVLDKEPDYELIKKLAVECRMPLCYGGGVRSVEQAERLVSMGVEKVALSSAALADPTLVTQDGERRRRPERRHGARRSPRQERGAGRVDAQRPTSYRPMRRAMQRNSWPTAVPARSSSTP